MTTLRSRRGKTHAIADCLTCGEQCPSGEDSPAVQGRWARRHAEQNPGHVAAVVSESQRTYQVEAAR